MGLCEDMISLITDSNKFIGDMPDVPDNSICIYETGGYDSEIQLNKSIVERPTFQVRVRNTSYVNASAKCDSIKLALNAITNITINSNQYIDVFLVGGNNCLGKDEKNRWIYTMNFKARIKK
jgi:hypothetical protein